MISNETWKDIEFCEGYAVSDQGRVLSKNYRRSGAEVIMRLAHDTNGFLIVNLKNKTYHVRFLVANSFLPKPDGKCWLKAKNGKRDDCRAVNLEWIPCKPSRKRKR
jgi:hypothetical protein